MLLPRLDRRRAIVLLLVGTLAIGTAGLAVAEPARSSDTLWSLSALWSQLRALWGVAGGSIDPDGVSAPPPSATPESQGGASEAGGYIDPGGVATPPAPNSSEAGPYIDPNG